MGHCNLLMIPVLSAVVIIMNMLRICYVIFPRYRGGLRAVKNEGQCIQVKCYVVWSAWMRVY